MDESPHFAPEWMVKTAWREQTPSVPSDATWIKRVEELFKMGNGNDIVWKINGMDYKYIFINTSNGWSLSEEITSTDGTTYYQTVNMRNGKFELFKNTVKNGQWSPGKIDLSVEGAKDKIADFLHKITLMNVGRQMSSLKDSIAFA